MGLRFNRRIKVAPGVRVNVGKKGVSSVSVGRRGGSLNVGKNGVRANAGIPGTGLSHSQKLVGRGAKARSRQGAEAPPERTFVERLILTLLMGALLFLVVPVVLIIIGFIIFD